jgi:mercuric ion binding protein
MRQTIAATVLGLTLLSSGHAVAAEQRVTLRVENMYCASCPFIIKQTLARVPGVNHVEISYEDKTAIAMAVVVYEDSETDADALTAATSKIGFPSTVIR